MVLRERDGRWTVSTLGPDRTLQAIAAELDLGYAQGVAEDTVRRWGQSGFAHPQASWRGLAASGPQLTHLSRRGLQPRPGMTRGEASDLLSVAFAARALEPATLRQRSALRRLGVPVPDGLTKGAASGLLEQALAGRRPDRRHRVREGTGR